MNNTEKRRYFRINDTIGLSYVLLGDTEAKGSTDAGNIEITTTHVLAEIDRELNTITNALWRENPVFAKAVGLLNRKIEVLTDEIAGNDQMPLERDQQQVNVSISGCGMAFGSATALKADQQLKLFITLKPSNTHISLHGQVIACEETSKDPAKPYWLRIEFSESDIAAQEELIRHIVQRQFGLKK